jgi:hypothetical protein
VFVVLTEHVDFRVGVLSVMQHDVPRCLELCEGIDAMNRAELLEPAYTVSGAITALLWLWREWRYTGSVQLSTSTSKLRLPTSNLSTPI